MALTDTNQREKQGVAKYVGYLITPTVAEVTLVLHTLRLVPLNMNAIG